MTQHSARLRLHMGCGESLNSRWLPAPAPRKTAGTAHATRPPQPSKQRRGRLRG